MKKLLRRHCAGILLTAMVVGQLFPAPVLAAEKAKNVIILLADGCASPHTTISRWYKGSPLVMEEIVAGALRTYTAESLITISAPASTP